MDKTFIFDYDDTLAWNQYTYSWAQLDFAKFVMKSIGARTPGPQEIINLGVSLELGLMKEMRFSPARFPTSCKLAYAEIRKKLGLAEDKVGEDVAYHIGTHAFDETLWMKEGLVHGAEQTLDFLVSAGDELLILTKGDYPTQKRKIEVTGCSQWFGDLDEGRIHIVNEKSPEIFSRVAGERDKNKVWAVGNSAKSDIIPALKAGVRAIYLPQETWAYEKNTDIEFMNNSRLVNFDQILDIKNRYSELV